MTRRFNFPLCTQLKPDIMNPFLFDLFIIFTTLGTESNMTCKHSLGQIRLGFPLELNSFYVTCLLLLFA